MWGECKGKYLYVHVYSVCVCGDTHACMYADYCLFRHLCTDKYAWINVIAHTHTHTHTHAHTHTHTQIYCSFSLYFLPFTLSFYIYIYIYIKLAF